MKRTPVVVGLVTSLLLAPVGFAAEFYIYPAKGQSADQQEKDKYECNQWAVKQTGFNPMDPPTATAPPPQQQAPQGGLFRGAARGALLGTAVGAIAGNTGEGAAIGAAAGGLFGGMRRRDQVAGEQQAQANYESQQSAQYEQRRSQWAGAYKTCLEGRGYTVS
jgi:hypothetical protein